VPAEPLLPAPLLPSESRPIVIPPRAASQHSFVYNCAVPTLASPQALGSCQTAVVGAPRRNLLCPALAQPALPCCTSRQRNSARRATQCKAVPPAQRQQATPVPTPVTAHLQHCPASLSPHPTHRSLPSSAFLPPLSSELQAATFAPARSCLPLSLPACWCLMVPACALVSQCCRHAGRGCCNNLKN